MKLCWYIININLSINIVCNSLVTSPSQSHLSGVNPRSKIAPLTPFPPWKIALLMLLFFSVRIRMRECVCVCVGGSEGRIMWDYWGHELSDYCGRIFRTSELNRLLLFLGSGRCPRRRFRLRQFGSTTTRGRIWCGLKNNCAHSRKKLQVYRSSVRCDDRWRAGGGKYFAGFGLRGETWTRLLRLFNIIFYLNCK